MQAAVSGRFGREECRRGGTGRRSRLKILIYTRELFGHCHLPTSGRLIERAHEVLTQPVAIPNPARPQNCSWQRTRLAARTLTPNYWLLATSQTLPYSQHTASWFVRRR